MMDSLKGLDLLACAVLILDRNGAIVYVNPAAEDLFESSSKVLLSQNLKQVFPNSDVLETLCEQVISHDCLEMAAGTGSGKNRRQPCTFIASSGRSICRMLLS